LLEWTVENEQDVVLLFLDFEKAFDRIKWGFIFTTLSKLGFNPKWIKWVSSLYWLASSLVKVNGESGKDFKLSISVRQGCPLAPYLFILATDVLGHMLDDTKYNVEGLTCAKEVAFETKHLLTIPLSTSREPKATWT
jgi:hypothetical protein